jgi:hypothetical protein
MNVISHVLVLVYYNTVVLSKNQIIQYILCQQDSYPRGDGWETIICLNTVTFLCLSQSKTYISNVIWWKPESLFMFNNHGIHHVNMSLILISTGIKNHGYTGVWIFKY